jgi:hypothetical protein
MKNPHQLFLAAFIISLLLHLLIVLSVYFPDGIITLVFSVGMFFSWLIISRVFRELVDQNPEFNLLQFFRAFPPIFKYVLSFYAFYALINFTLTFSVETGTGWVEFNLSPDKLRGISGFWPFFYLFAFSVLKQKTNNGTLK